MGVVSAIGTGLNAVAQSIDAARSGVRAMPGDAARGLAPYLAATVEAPPNCDAPPMQLNQMDRLARMGLDAAQQAIRQARLDAACLDRDRAAVYWGTGMGGAGTLDDAYQRFLATPTQRAEPLTVVKTMTNASAAHIALRYGLRGPVLVVSNACASSAQALGEALRLLRSGAADVAIAGGAEALIAPGIVRAWQAMGVLAHYSQPEAAAACRPFDQARTGLVLGEGAAVFVLETQAHAHARGASPLAELAGYGCTCDAAHLSKPDTDGQARAMRQALHDASLQADDVGYINAHGTATPAGDRIEAQSIRAVFGDRPPPTSSTKALHGHLLGAAGALELAISIQALQRNVLPPTAHLDAQDPEVDLDCIPGRARRLTAPLHAVMSNSFAFGGTNAVLVARRAD
jgi:3-oxoacyl-[acyl-carrier-protein] synthase II